MVGTCFFTNIIIGSQCIPSISAIPGTKGNGDTVFVWELSSHFNIVIRSSEQFIPMNDPMKLQSSAVNLIVTKISDTVLIFGVTEESILVFNAIDGQSKS